MMAKQRRPTDPMAAAEAAFKPIKKPLAATPSPPGVPNARELVSLRIDRQVLEHFQQSGPGWQERINDELRRVVSERNSQKGTSLV